MSDEEIESKCLRYSLKNVEEGHRVHKLLLKPMIPFFFVLLGGLVLASVISGVLHVKTRKKEGRYRRFFDNT
ncbi:MAG: hypothetical protein IK106_01885 [Clostridiales bacterium]|nr:hypothetical protein [Clostridiales bacterium]